ncbi:hypothetical protein [Streptomyces sp. NPDC058614]|uniref:hypothetical protein n=1 Tax=Streptomyces sp. NPDC058614 TaxID=3346557 RepID=UPI003665C5CD
MKRAVVGVLAGALIFTGAGTALAAWGKSMPLLESAGVEFAQGRYKFNPAGTNHGSFEWKGKLRDLSPGDGHNVYMQVRVEGHDWVRYYGKQGRSVSLHQSNWDGAQRYTTEVYIRACRDRGALRPDNCSRTKFYENRLG